MLQSLLLLSDGGIPPFFIVVVLSCTGIGLVYACDEKEEENAYLPFHDNATSMTIQRKVFEYLTFQIIPIILAKNYNQKHKNLCMQQQILPGISHSTIQVEKVGCRPPPPPPLLITQRTLVPPLPALSYLPSALVV